MKKVLGDVNDIMETSTQKTFTNQGPPAKFPFRKFPTELFPPGIFPPMFLNNPTHIFFCFCLLILHYYHRYYWQYVKDCFAIPYFKNAEVRLAER